MLPDCFLSSNYRLMLLSGLCGVAGKACHMEFTETPTCPSFYLQWLIHGCEWDRTSRVCVTRSQKEWRSFGEQKHLLVLRKGLEEPHLFMAVVVMVEEFCTFVIIGPGLISRGLLPCSVEVTSTVCKSWAQKKKRQD